MASFVVFDSARKKLLLKFMPSIAEVVAEIERQNRRWNKRFSALDGIEDCYEELVQLIAQSEVAVASSRRTARARSGSSRTARAAAEISRTQGSAAGRR